MVVVGLYLAAIVAANLSVAAFGATFAVINAFVFIAFDLFARDVLHDRWHGRGLVVRMALLIFTGSVLSALFNINALPIAVASFAAFAVAGLMDMIVYQRLLGAPRWARMNGSNAVSALVDSTVFVLIAFSDLPAEVRISIIATAYVAKVAGGFFWTFVYTLLAARQKQKSDSPDGEFRATNRNRRAARFAARE